MWLNYHNITKDDMNNGDGLRVVLWVAGCGHHCEGCQNPQTWDANSGIPFDDWVYTGFEWEKMTFREKYFFNQIDVVVDGKFVEELKDVNYPWAGSTNQRVIDVKKTMSNGKGKVILYERD